MTERSSSSRRHLVLVLLFAVVAAACGGGDAVTDGADTSSTSARDGSPGSVPATQADGSPAPTTASTGTPPTSSGSASPATTAAAPATTAAPRATVPSLAGPGSWAGFFLRPSPGGAETVLIDVFSADGAQARTTTTAHVRDTIARVSQKPVELRQQVIAAPSKSWTADELRALGDANGPASSALTAVMKLFFLHGDFAGDDGVLGIAVRSEVAAVFVDKIDQATGIIDSPSDVEKAVTTHEVGHLLGLVDLFLDTGRDDPEHPKHSDNPDSVMYWAVESVFISQLVEGAPPSDFDNDDLADLATIRNG